MDQDETEHCRQPNGCGETICVVCFGCRCCEHHPDCPFFEDPFTAVNDGGPPR